MEFIKPNWSKSNLNITATLAEFLGAPNTNKTLPIIKDELKNGYKNVVFICLDGMGINPINVNLQLDAFLRKNIVMTLTSTFPSTTTCATTSLTSNKMPLEHGWFGWSMHFDEINKNVDVYLRKSSDNGEEIDFQYPMFDNTDYYFDHAVSEYSINTIFPSFVRVKYQNRNIVINNEGELCRAIRDICNRKGKQFIYAYYNEPDATMHTYGVTSNEAKSLIININNEIEKLVNELTDTLVIITADHGQIDVEGYVEFYKDAQLMSLLKCAPYLDARAPAFNVKEGKEAEFENLFKNRYGEDFELHKSSELIGNGYFGDHGKYGYLLGDYIAIGTMTHKIGLPYPDDNKVKGHHTSLTEEMLVPLIMYKKK